jgi:putative addiction module component (TIGR02574 family)
MSDKAKSVLEAALGLPPDDRNFIIDQLAKSLPPSPIDAMSDHDLELELDRRAAEFARDPSVASPWKEFDWDAVE